jgi:hypothetical protein
VVDEHLERAAIALYLAEYPSERWDEATRYWQSKYRRLARIAVEAWDHGGATMLSDFPLDASSIDIITNEDGSLTVRRKPIPWRPLHEGYGPDHS